MACREELHDEMSAAKDCFAEVSGKHTLTESPERQLHVLVATTEF